MFKLAIVDTDRTPMWYLPGTDIYLNFANPEIEVDENTLTNAQKKTIELDVKRKAISTSIPITIEEVKEIIVEAKKEKNSEPKIIKPENYMKEKLKKAKEMLEMKLADLKKNIKSESISDLRILLEEERISKNRKTVIKAIELAISKHQSEVFNNVAKELGDIPFQDIKSFEKGFNGLNLDNIEDILESDLEEIPIKLGAEK